jgi:hypothetical protein
VHSAALVALASANSDDLALNWLLFGGIRNDESTSCGGLALESLDNYAVEQWSDFQSFNLVGFGVCWCSAARPSGPAGKRWHDT